MENIRPGSWKWVLEKVKNSEIYKLDDEPDVKFITLGRLRWAGHVMRMDERDPAKKFLCTKREGNGDKRRGRPKLKW